MDSDVLFYFADKFLDFQLAILTAVSSNGLTAGSREVLLGKSPVQSSTGLLLYL